MESCVLINEKSIQFFSEVTDGMINRGDLFKVAGPDLSYDIYDYSYTVHVSHLHDAKYNPPTIQSSKTEGECHISYFDNKLLVDVRIPNFNWDDFKPEFFSYIDPQKCRIEGEEGEKVRTVIIPFPDMSNDSKESYRLEFMFENINLISIILTEFMLDDNLCSVIKSLQLIGNL